MSAGRSRLRVALSWVPALLYTGAIWWLSSQTELDFVMLERMPLQDKGVHLVEYAGLAITIAFAAYVSWPGRKLRPAVAAVWITIGLGLVDELHQLFVPGRTGDVLDLAADGVGAVLGVTLYGLVRLALRCFRPAASTPVRPTQAR